MSTAAAALSLAVAIACTAHRSPAAAQPVQPTGSVAIAGPVESNPIASDSLAAALLVDVERLEAGIVVQMRYATPDNFTGAPLPGYEANRALLRREAAVALAGVARQLADSGLALKIFDAYRPVRATEEMVAWARRTSREQLFRDGYISSRSRHNLGLAVDLTLIELASGRELEMGTAYDTFTEAAHTANASGIAAANRQRLVNAMRRAGFVNYPREWWHFSFDVPDPHRFDMVIR